MAVSRILKYNEAKIKISRLLRERALQPGDKLPTERELEEKLGVSIICVRRALEELQSAGIITKRHGVGSFYRGNIENVDCQSTLGLVSVADPGFPAGAEIAELSIELRKRHANYRLFSVDSALATEISDGLALCDRFIISGFINRHWLDFIASQGKPFVQVGVSEYRRKVCKVVFDWDDAFRRIISNYKRRNLARLALMIINPRAANCSVERSKLFIKLMQEAEMPVSEEMVLFVDPTRPAAHIAEFIRGKGVSIDAILTDLHVFDEITLSNLVHHFTSLPEIVVMQTARRLPDEFNSYERLGQVYFKGSIIRTVIEVLYDRPYSFIESCGCAKLEPVLEGRVFEGTSNIDAGKNL